MDFLNPGGNNYVEERRRMVAAQLMERGISNQAVLHSMLSVPRHLFVPVSLREKAYHDGPLPIGRGQTISQPYIVALMAEALEPSRRDRVLEIGTGSGYGAAVLSLIVAGVYTIERHELLAKQAESVFQNLKYKNIQVLIGDGTKGWPAEAPFDGIVVTAGAPDVPGSLLGQLITGGRLVIPVGAQGRQELLRLRKKPDGSCARESLGPVRFVPLIGDEGWN
ncbi:MAG: protein-L-isoaspartate(D-aspartate) O-methyltransferase [Bacillota bacterium]|jgi:protein-L-isoaspartate(D-aspartate) O-methyltransferase